MYNFEKKHNPWFLITYLLRNLDWNDSIGQKKVKIFLFFFVENDCYFFLNLKYGQKQQELFFNQVFY